MKENRIKHINHQRIFRFIMFALWCTTILAAVKVIFQSYGFDEEYQLLMSYRNLEGDRMFMQMWEPHQTSAFLNTFLMKLYVTLAGSTTGVVIFLRLCGTLIHAAISIFFYKCCLKLLEHKDAVLIALIYFNFIPKMIQMPEFALMQMWFLTLVVLFLFCGYDSRKKITYAILSGIAMSLAVLAYPTCILLFMVAVIFIWTSYHEADRIKTIVAFSTTCLGCGLGYILFILRSSSISSLISVAGYILSADDSHDIMISNKIMSFGTDILTIAFSLTLIFILAIIITFFQRKFDRNEIETKTQYLILINAVVVACAVQLVYWLVLNRGYEYFNLYLLVIVLAGIGMVKTEPKGRFQRALLRFGIVTGIVAFLATLLLTNLSILMSVTHLFVAAIFALIVITVVLKDRRKIIRPLLICVCLTVIMGKGYTLRASGDYNNILESRGILKYGPAIGTVSDYMGAYIYNNTYELWQKEISQNAAMYGQETPRVLVVTNCLHAANTTQYMFGGASVCHYSTIDPPSYNEQLLTYWKKYPEKQPDIIVVDCWFGELLFEEDSWIMQYIENDFGYSQVIDGDYVRIYKKGAENESSGFSVCNE